MKPKEVITKSDNKSGLQIKHILQSGDKVFSFPWDAVWEKKSRMNLPIHQKKFERREAMVKLPVLPYYELNVNDKTFTNFHATHIATDLKQNNPHMIATLS